MKIFFFTLLFIFQTYLIGQVIDTAYMSQSIDYSSVQGMVTTKNGITYLTGKFADSLTFHGKTATSNNLSYDIWLAKLKGNQAEWVNYVGGENVSYDEATSITIDESENVIISGHYGSASTFGGSISVPYSGASDDGFVCKYDSSGSIVWVQTINTSSTAYIHDVKCDLLNNVYVSGEYSGSGNFGDTTLITSTSSGFLAKLDSNGIVLWIKLVSGSGIQRFKYLDIDQHGNIYTTGTFESTADFGDTVLTATASQFVFIAKYDTHGNFIWASKEGGASASPQDIELNDSESKFFLCLNSGFGGTYGGVNTVFGGNHVVIAQYDTSAVNIWAQTIFGNFPGAGRMKLSVQDSAIYMLARTDYFPHWQQLVSETEFNNLMLVKFDFSGNIIWANGVGKAYIPQLYYLVDTDTSGNIYFSYNIADSSMCGQNIFYVNDGHEIVYGQAKDGAAIIQGVVFQDINNTGLYDIGDAPLENVIVEALPSGHYSSTNAGGNYKMFVPTGNHTVKCYLPIYHYPTPDSINVTLPTNFSSSIGVNFIDSTVQAWDMKVMLNSITPNRPGFEANYNLSYVNKGTVTTSGSISLKLDSFLTFNSSIPAPSLVTSDSIYWNYSGVLPAEYHNIIINTTVSFSAPLSSILSNYVRIDPLSSDSLPIDNIFLNEEMVSGSYDPNDKRALPDSILSPQFVSNGNTIQYTIRFQNTGTDTAFNIRIEDSLSSLLDISSFRLLSHSHYCLYELTDNGRLVVYFPNIKLPDSTTNETLSHGYFNYQVNVRENMETLDTIYNNAEIYFDFNAPIFTNTTMNYIVFPLSIKDKVVSESVVTYPNPICQGQLLRFTGLSPESTYVFTLYSMDGKKIERLSVSNGQTRLKNGITSGVYLYELSLNKSTIVRGKIIIQ